MNAYRDFCIMIIFCSGVMNCIPSHSWTTPRVTSRGHRIESKVCIDVSVFERPNVLKAVKAWNKAIGAWQHFFTVNKKPDIDCDLSIQEVEPDPEKSVTVLATTEGLGIGRIKLFRGRYEIDSYAVTLHEMGHALGANHLRGTLMDSKLNFGVYHCPDVATVLQIAYINGINPEMLSWCQ